MSDSETALLGTVFIMLLVLIGSTLPHLVVIPTFKSPLRDLIDQQIQQREFEYLEQEHERDKLKEDPKKIFKHPDFDDPYLFLFDEDMDMDDILRTELYILSQNCSLDSVFMMNKDVDYANVTGRVLSLYDHLRLCYVDFDKDDIQNQSFYLDAEDTDLFLEDFDNDSSMFKIISDQEDMVLIPSLMLRYNFSLDFKYNDTQDFLLLEDLEREIASYITAPDMVDKFWLINAPNKNTNSTDFYVANGFDEGTEHYNLVQEDIEKSKAICQNNDYSFKEISAFFESISEIKGKDNHVIEYSHGSLLDSGSLKDHYEHDIIADYSLYSCNSIQNPEDIEDFTGLILRLGAKHIYATKRDTHWHEFKELNEYLRDYTDGELFVEDYMRFYSNYYPLNQELIPAITIGVI